jgi:hypothetical protein
MTVKAYIYFDGNFNYEELASKYVSLDELIYTAKCYINEYNFATANIVDAETGEVLVTMERDWQDENCDDCDDDIDDTDNS